MPMMRTFAEVCLLWSATAALGCGGDPEPDKGTGGAWGRGELVLAVDALGLVVPGLTVNILGPDCGDDSVVQSAVTNGDGIVRFSGLQEESVRVQVVGDTELGYIDSWSHHVRVGDSAWAGDQPIPIPVVGAGSAAVVEANAMFTAEQGASAIVGAAYEGTGPGDRTPAGCLTVELADDPQNGTVRYFGDQDLPNTTSTETSTINGRFYVGNASPGEHTIHVLSGGERIGSETVCIQPRQDATTDDGNVFLVGVYLPQGAAPACSQ